MCPVSRRFAAMPEAGHRRLSVRVFYREPPASADDNETDRPPAPAAGGAGAAPVQGVGNGSEPARAGGPDLQHDRKHVGGKPVGISPRPPASSRFRGLPSLAPVAFLAAG